MQFIGDNNDTGPQPRQAIIYNCRTSNAWPEDLALTVTHFPEERVTFAILFGCSEKTERNVIARLKRAGQDAAHPMLLPGIVAELERSRQMEIVEKMIDNVEGEIFQLDTRHVSSWRHSDSDRVRRNRKKRVAWLNTTYARNALTSWKTQLSKMAGQVDEYTALVDQILGYSMEDLKKCASSRSPKSSVEDPMLLEGLEATSTVDEDVESRKELAAKESFQDDEPELSAHEQRPKWGEVLQAEIKHRQETLKVGMSLKDRLVAICDEYEDRVRDCTMRVEGMAMTTQWSHGETNVEIATATGQDSSQMRSIALVTMIFLPGTFFASIFSMSFFNWSPSGASGDQERQPFVSQYIWIYVSVTALFTLATLTLFWYFIIHRPKRARKLDDDDSDCESIDF
ncbi:hypothetical protein B0H63DRAFT_525268 [Podospora didyma]|uniref:Uncharacterized protein n=1 Tax=Podospora didyma TaxID=330526 RepID=A0AAE0KJV9_9PEZI|nr:hypothetical protein B0H63DRAFT_525268 [Podospora didyma]